VNAAIREALSRITVAEIAPPRLPAFASLATDPVSVLVAE
jgi:hypothetical protein